MDYCSFLAPFSSSSFTVGSFVEQQLDNGLESTSKYESISDVLTSLVKP
jgi:hypothetical protein